MYENYSSAKVGKTLGRDEKNYRGVEGMKKVSGEALGN
jgi:hypothetical protein